MISVLSKPSGEIGINDIHELIDSAVPEGEQIDFKEALSTKGNSLDRWVTHGGRIGDKARNEILEGAVAFANAYGGALVLGIRESKDEDKPGIAEEITAIPRCEELAQRLKLVFRDCVEPQIPGLQIFAVPTEDDGAGVVIIRTGRSRMAPHRVKPTRKCPIRRADRCEELTMREIQDLTLNLSRGLERLERRLAVRSKRFGEEFRCLDTPDCAVGFRVTAAPVVEDIRFDHVYGEDSLYGTWHRISLSLEDGQIQLESPWWGTSWYPKLRAARSESFGRPSGTTREIYREIHCDGLVEIGLVDCRVDGSYGTRFGLRLGSTDLVNIFANLIVWADHVRNRASTPTAEYAVDVELYIRGESVSVLGYGADGYFSPHGPGKLEPGSVRYPGDLQGEPRYSLSEQARIPELIELFERDFFNSFGVDVRQGKRRFEVEDWIPD